MLKASGNRPDNRDRLKEHMMTKRRSSLFSVLVAVAATTALTGCETGFVSDAARESLSSFVVNVLTTAVTESINPSE